MKIVEDYKSEYHTTVIKVVRAKYHGDFQIIIKFNDESTNIVDFKRFLSESRHPSIQKYNDESLFKQFKIIDGNLNWNDYDLIFPISDLKSGQI